MKFQKLKFELLHDSDDLENEVLATLFEMCNSKKDFVGLVIDILQLGPLNGAGLFRRYEEGIRFFKAHKITILRITQETQEGNGIQISQIYPSWQGPKRNYTNLENQTLLAQFAFQEILRRALSLYHKDLPQIAPYL